MIVAAVWWRRYAHSPPGGSLTAVESTVAIRVTRHDKLGMPVGKPIAIRDPGRVRAFVIALGVDGHPETACPSDYASAELGIVLHGRDVYAKRNVYVWAGEEGDAGAGSLTVVTSTSSGCRGGRASDPTSLRRLLDEAEAAQADGGRR